MIEAEWARAILFRERTMVEVATEHHVTPTTIRCRLHQLCKRSNKRLWNDGRFPNWFNADVLMPPSLEYLRENAREFIKGATTYEG